MATPFGHYLLGLSITQSLARDPAEKKSALWWAAVACVPDLDLIPGLLFGRLAQFHHGISHSFAAAAFFSLAVLLVWRGRPENYAWRTFAISFVLYSSHVILDFLTLDTADPRGVPLFWPVSGEPYQSPWLLLPNVQHSRAPIMSGHNFLLIIREALLFIPLLGLIQALKVARWPGLWTAVWLYGGWFVAAVFISALSLR
jgi:inner membrane protein